MARLRTRPLLAAAAAAAAATASAAAAAASPPSGSALSSRRHPAAFGIPPGLAETAASSMSNALPAAAAAPAALQLQLQLQHGLSSAALALSDASSSLPAPPAALPAVPDLLAGYRQLLLDRPLPTKMATGALVALAADALAQTRVPDEPYDRRRAASFMAFDACYRALQHWAYPPMVAQLHGQYVGAALGAVPPLAAAAAAAAEAAGLGTPSALNAVLEQTMASQLVIVPLIYYPVFYSITGALQELTVEETMQRARDTFVPLMRRNLLFWIPVQFVQFGFVEESLQIPFVTACGLVWNVILSVLAGSAQPASPSSAASVASSSASAASASAASADRHRHQHQRRQQQQRQQQQPGGWVRQGAEAAGTERREGGRNRPGGGGRNPGDGGGDGLGLRRTARGGREGQDRRRRRRRGGGGGGGGGGEGVPHARIGEVLKEHA